MVEWNRGMVGGWMVDGGGLFVLGYFEGRGGGV